MSISYTDLIVEAVVSYGEVKGTSKEDLWKATVSKKPEADLKQFTLRLKKLLEQGVLKSSNYKYRLCKVYHKKLLSKLEKGQDSLPIVVSKSRATTKKSAKKGESKRRVSKKKTSPVRASAVKSRRSSKVTKRSINGKKARASKAKNSRKKVSEEVVKAGVPAVTKPGI